MSNEVRDLVLEELGKGEAKSVSELKQIASEKKIDGTEGTWAAAMRDLSLVGKIQKISRGVYKIAEDEFGIIDSCINSLNKAHSEIKRITQSIDVFELETEDIEKIKRIKEALTKLQNLEEELKQLKN